jgi:anti-anti-sigma factor
MINDIKVATLDANADILSIAVLGSLDAVLAYKLQSEVEERIRQGHKKYLVDFADLEYISSAGVGVLSALILYLQKKQGKMLFLNIPERVLELLHLTRLFEIFSIAENAEDALRELRAEAGVQ